MCISSSAGPSHQVSGDEAAWIALFTAALVARPRLTAEIDNAVSLLLARDNGSPAEACLALAHVIARHASRAENAAALLDATLLLARTFLTSAPAREPPA